MMFMLRSWKYWLLGPTTLHLQYELCLLICMVLLAVGSMNGLYQGQLKRGDGVFLALLTLVSSRHFLFRLWSTWTPRTLGCSVYSMPSCILSHFIQSHLIGGQVMDRPPPAHRSFNNMHLNSANHGSSIGSSNANHHTMSASDRLAQIVGTNASQHHHGNNNSQSSLGVNGYVTVLNLLPSTLAYTMQLLQPFVWYPLSLISTLFQLNNKPTEESSSSKRQHQQHYYVSLLRPVLHKAQQLWCTFGFSLQFVLYTLMGGQVLEALYTWVVAENVLPSVRFLGHPLPMPAMDADSSLLRHPDNRNSSTNGLGNYSRRNQPDWPEVFWFLCLVSTLISAMLVFYRFFPPLLDWAAGNAVVKDVKLEARHYHADLHPKKRGGAWRDLFCFPRDQGSTPWVERLRSIGSSANRLQTSIYFVMTRLLENVVLFGIAPRSQYICRFTGHCPAGPSTIELSCLLHPTGYTQPSRRDCQTSELMESHFESFCVVFLGVVVITGFLLTAQTVILQRSYLATLSHIMADWKRIRPPMSIVQVCKSVLFSKHHHRHHHPQVWDPHRKYRQGDTVAFPNSYGAIYQACQAAPEGRPPDDHLLYGYDVLSSSRSNILFSMAQHQSEVIVVGHVAWHILSMLWLDGEKSSWWLLWVLAAHVLAGHCLVGALSFRSNDRGRLRQLSAELNSHVDPTVSTAVVPHNK